MGAIVIEQPGQRLRPAVDVARSDHTPHAPRLDEVCQHVTPRHDQRRPAGDVIQQPRAEGQPRFERVAMRAHPNICLGEPGEALVIRHPGSVEEDRAPIEPELCRERDGLIGHRHLADRAARMRQPEEQQLDVASGLRETCDGADDGQRVEPVPDPTAPEQQAVGRLDPRQHSFHRRPRCGRSRVDAERHDGDERRQGRIVCVGLRGHSPERRERPQPVIALPVAGAEKRVSEQKRDACRGDDLVVANALQPIACLLFGEEGGGLHECRRIEIEDQPDACPAQPSYQAERQGLRHDDVGCQTRHRSHGLSLSKRVRRPRNAFTRCDERHLEAARRARSRDGDTESQDPPSASRPDPWTT